LFLNKYWFWTGRIIVLSHNHILQRDRGGSLTTQGALPEWSVNHPPLVDGFLPTYGGRFFIHPVRDWMVFDPPGWFFVQVVLVAHLRWAERDPGTALRTRPMVSRG
jgi:hypothetical protein